MTAYYNEFDPFAAEWLRNLIKQGLIADGIVDERSITSVEAADLGDFTQCHFFAGIGGWSHALRLAGWPDDRPVWTGSCPCQPFSAAGKRGGTDDERHLWPEWFRLIRECRPPVIFGEQVASSIATGRYGGDGVQSLWQTWQLLNLRKDWLERRPTVHLQGLPKLGCAERGNGKTHEPGNASQQTGSVGEGPSRIPEDGIRLGRAVGSGEDRAGGLPDERRAVRSVGDAWVCDPVPGPDQSDFGLHERQHQGDPLRAECGAGELGTDQTVQCRDADIKDQLEAINDLIAEVSRDIEEANGASWLNALQLDLGREGYTVGACAAPACSLGAPHIRQRLWIVGERVADSDKDGCDRLAAPRLHERRDGSRSAEQAQRSVDGPLGDDTDGRGLDGRPGPTNGNWRAADWLHCRDGKWRPVEPGTFPLAHGLPNRVGRLRGYGNAIVPQVAAEVIAAWMECRP